MEKDKPALYCCAYDYYTDDGRFIRRFNLPKKISLCKSLYYTAASGFTIVFNEALRKKALKGIEKSRNIELGELHDRRFIRVALIFGDLILDFME